MDYGAHETEHVDIVGDEVTITDAVVELTGLLHERFPDLDLGLIDCGNWRETILTCVLGLSLVWRPSHGLPNYKTSTR